MATDIRVSGPADEVDKWTTSLACEWPSIAILNVSVIPTSDPSAKPHKIIHLEANA